MMKQTLLVSIHKVDVKAPLFLHCLQDSPEHDCVLGGQSQLQIVAPCMFVQDCYLGQLFLQLHQFKHILHSSTIFIHLIEI